MTRDDIIRMAREAGIHHGFDSEGQWDGLTNTELFERHPHPGDKVYGEKRMVEILERFVALVAAAEREECAKVCEDIDKEYEGEDVLATWCAAAIRARSK
jgi:hypothetical protein